MNIKMRKLLILLTLCLPLLAAAQNTRKISGQVLEAATGEPLPGATVFIDPNAPEAKEYNPAGTVTDVNGHFELILPASIKYVVVSFIGYEALKLDIAGKTEFTVHLKEELKQLDEVVVTGYQKIEKRKVTSSITTVKTDDIKSIGVPSIDQMLEGQVAGMMVTPTNGAPGAPAKMRVRSTVSLSGNTDPLWVLDGMILEGNDIPKDFGDKDNIDNLYNTSIAGVNPADIEDITILKDAAATAIYGARAANGVIVVTTKKGAKGKMRVNASASLFVTTRPDLSKLNLMNASEKVDFELGLASRQDFGYRSYKGGVSRILSGANELDAFQNGGFGALTANTQNSINLLRNQGADWEKEVYQNALNQQYNLSFSGGSDQAAYYFSAGYFNEEGTTIGTGFERFNITMKTDFNLLDNLKLGVAMFVNQNTRKSYITDTDAFTNPANYTRSVNPYREIFDENGDYIYDKDIEGYSGEDLDFNLIEERENTHYSMKSLSLRPMLTLDYKPASWLKLSSQFSMQLDRDKTEKMAEKDTYYVRKYRESTRYYDKGYKYFLPDGGIIQNWNNDMNQYQWKLQGEFAKTFAEKHDVDVMAGMEMRGSKATNIHTKGFGYDPKALTTVGIVFPSQATDAADNDVFRQYKKQMSEDRFLSYYMTASYTYDNRYTFFGSLRYDGSNLFGVSRKYKYLPLWAVSGAWNINRESFMQDADWLSNLKLRLSYGIQGNVDKNTSPTIVGSWGNATILPGVNEPSIDVTSPPNQNLRWEKTANWNAGLDMGILKNRISFSFDGYYRRSTDLIGLRTLPSENGFGSTTMNWAQLTNKGFEFSLSTVNVKTRDFRWVMDFNIAHNKSNIDKIKVHDSDYMPSREGYSVGAKFALKTAGLDEKGIPMFWKGDQKVSFNDFFDIQYSDLGFMVFVSGSNLSTAEFRNLFTYIGTDEPKFTGGFINRFYYKNFDLTVSTSFVLKQTVQETPFYSPTKVSPGSNYSRRMMDVWSPENPNGRYPAILGETTEGYMNLAYQWLDGGDPANTFRNYDIWYKERSYLRVNSIRLGYTLPESLTKKLRLANARVSFESRNPFVFGTSYKGYFDPESYGNIYAQPQPQTFSCGLDLTF